MLLIIPIRHKIGVIKICQVELVETWAIAPNSRVGKAISAQASQGTVSQLDSQSELLLHKALIVLKIVNTTLLSFYTQSSSAIGKTCLLAVTNG